MRTQRIKTFRVYKLVYDVPTAWRKDFWTTKTISTSRIHLESKRPQHSERSRLPMALQRDRNFTARLFFSPRQSDCQQWNTELIVFSPFSLSTRPDVGGWYHTRPCTGSVARHYQRRCSRTNRVYTRSQRRLRVAAHLRLLGVTARVRIARRTFGENKSNSPTVEN